MKAITDCRLIVFSKKDWKKLLNTVVGWDTIVHKIILKALLQKVERISPIVSEDATTRYLSFMEKYSNLVNRIPLSYIASYLGVTYPSLSKMAYELRDLPFKVNAIDPGYTETDFNQHSGPGTVESAATFIVEHTLTDENAPTGKFFSNDAEDESKESFW